MLHRTKNLSILQWFNSLTTKDTIESLSQLADGIFFNDIIQSLLYPEEPPHATPEVQESPKAEPDVTGNEGAHIISDMAMDVAENVEIEAGNVLDVSASSGEFDIETCDTEHSGKGHSAEVDARYVVIKQFIDDFFNQDSGEIITYPECKNGKEVELAKVCVILLSSIVQSYLATGDQALYTITLLDTQVQEDIKECLSLVLDDKRPFQKAELLRILGRPAKFKETPNRRTRRASDATKETPKSIGKRNERLSTISMEGTPDSPLKILLDSPSIQFKADLIRKDNEIKKLRRALDVQESSLIDFKAEQNAVNEELEQKKREIEASKEELRKYREFSEEQEALKQTKIEEQAAEIEKLNQMIHSLKQDAKQYQNEADDFVRKISEMEEKLSRRRAPTMSQSEAVTKLQLSIDELEELCQIKEDRIVELDSRNEAIRYQLKTYKDMFEELVSKTKQSADLNESDSEEMDQDQSLVEKLRVKDIECSELRRELLEKEMKITQLEAFSKSAQNDRFKSQQKFSFLMNENERLQKENAWYCQRLESIEQSTTIATVNQSSSNDCNAVFDEPTVGQLWGTCDALTVEESASPPASLKDAASHPPVVDIEDNGTIVFSQDAVTYQPVIAAGNDGTIVGSKDAPIDQPMIVAGDDGTIVGSEDAVTDQPMIVDGDNGAIVGSKDAVTHPPVVAAGDNSTIVCSNDAVIHEPMIVNGSIISSKDPATHPPVVAAGDDGTIVGSKDAVTIPPVVAAGNDGTIVSSKDAVTIPPVVAAGDDGTIVGSKDAVTHPPVVAAGNDGSVVVSKNQICDMKKWLKEISRFLLTHKENFNEPAVENLPILLLTLESVDQVPGCMEVFLKVLKSMNQQPQPAEEKDSPMVIKLLAQIKALREFNKSLDEKVSSTKEKTGKLLYCKNQELAELKEEYEKLKTKFGATHTRLYEFKAAYERTKAKYETVKGYIASVSAEKNRLKAEVAEMKESFKIQLQNLQNERKQHCENCARKDRELCGLEEEYKRLRSQITDLEMLRNILETKVSKSDLHIAELKQEIEDLTLKYEQECGFFSGSASRRNSLISAYFDRAQKEEKKKADAAAVYNVNTYILHPTNLSTERQEVSRMDELRRRNTLVPSQLKSSYPVELVDVTPTVKKYFEEPQIKRESSASEYCPKDAEASFQAAKKRKISSASDISTASSRYATRSRAPSPRARPVTPRLRSTFRSSATLNRLVDHMSRKSKKM